MSFDKFHRRGRPRQWACHTPDHELLPVRAHLGNPLDFLRRHQRECSRYDRLKGKQRKQFRQDLLRRIADTRNLWCAVEHLTRNGEKAPGPNQEVLTRLKRKHVDRVWNELRQLEQNLLNQTYTPGSVRRIRISKGVGRGTRPIEIANWQDQVVQRAVVQIIQPLLDPKFDDLSLGYRPGRDRTEAIARALAIAESDQRFVWITADVKDAFTCVPHQFLLDCLKEHLQCPAIANLVSTILRGDPGNPSESSTMKNRSHTRGVEAGREGDACKRQQRRKGIPQGGPLSPLLLNLVLHKGLDRRWKSQHPSIPMIRLADDILILCQTIEEAQQCRRDLERYLTPLGMKLKGNPESDLRDLNQGDCAVWLGLQISVQAGQLKTTLPANFWQKVRNHLQEELQGAQGILGCQASLLGCVEQLGAVYQDLDRKLLIRTLAGIAETLGIPEIVSRKQIRKHWEQSAARFLVQRRLWKQITLLQRALHPLLDQSSASGHRIEPENLAEVSAEPQVTAENPTASKPCVLMVDTTQLPSHMGSWGYAIYRPGHEPTEMHYKTQRNLTEERRLQRAITVGLRQIDASTESLVLLLRNDPVRGATVLSRNAAGVSPCAGEDLPSEDWFGRAIFAAGFHIQQRNLDGPVDLSNLARILVNRAKPTRQNESIV